MGNRVEVTLQVGVIHGLPPALEFLLDRRERLMSLSTRTEAVRAVEEIGLEDRLQDEHRGHLDHTITDRGDSQRALAPIRFQDVDAADRSRLVALAAQRLLDFVQEPLRAVLRVHDLVDRDSVDPRRSPPFEVRMSSQAASSVSRR